MTEKPLKLMLVARNFPPIKGGMEKLNQHMLFELSQSYKTFLVGPKGSAQHAASAELVKESDPRLSRFIPSSIWHSSRIAISQKPDIILAGSGLTAISAWAASWFTKSRWGIYLHGLDVVVESLVYKTMILPIIRRADFWIVNSNATKDAAIKAGIDSSRIHLLHPGVQIPENLPPQSSIEAWCKAHDVTQEHLLVSVGRLARRKGLVEFVTRCLPLIVDEFPNACLMIVGEEPKDSVMSEGGYRDEILRTAEQSGVSDNIKLLGAISDEDLCLAFSSAKLHIFPVLQRKGDMEGFGMVSIEAASFGTPTIAFSVGGVVDAVQHNVSGELVESGNFSEFTRAIINSFNGQTAYDIEKIRRFASRFSWEQFGGKLRNIEPLRK